MYIPIFNFSQIHYQDTSSFTKFNDYYNIKLKFLFLRDKMLIKLDKSDVCGILTCKSIHNYIALNLHNNRLAESVCKLSIYIICRLLPNMPA